ncbi:hypothetical protein BDF20DRAFT_858762 [Mycotypha africana]|uniref:uncharacterized protein n=1 Tax=Mycotypha africana TaxID=64632 RepID=UPI002300D8AF|nr:uncharacterized protein BDF20DRAFT_858762 [Mycotypha africana]KAI8984236.1 hypothetical protein BDF20DRAFT_858762 [Mycotypha africana]
MFDSHSNNKGKEPENNDSNWTANVTAPTAQQPAPPLPQQLRRHSVTVGEMHFHSFDNKNQHHHHFNHNELDHILASFPSSWSSTSSSSMASSFNQQQSQRHPSIFDNTTMAVSPTPAFFSPSFLDALKHEDNNPFQSFPPIATADVTATNNIITTTAPPTATARNTINPNEDLLLQDFIIPTTATTAPTMTTTTATAASGSISVSLPPLQPTFYTSFYHPSIPEEEVVIKNDEEDGFDSVNAITTNSTSTFPITPPATNEDLKPSIRHYLSTFENERKITILTSKVAQKSYGTEKRFLCPPPLTVLSGSLPWFIHGKEPKVQVQIKGENQSVQNGNIEWQPSEESDNKMKMTGACVAKHLHINDSTVNSSSNHNVTGGNDEDKRKRVQIQVNIQLGGTEDEQDMGISRDLGTFYSKGIKVISKPSKKRQSVKNMELCIHHGSLISLFNRIRSQTVSTKYLGVSVESESNTDNPNNTCFIARTNKWDPFVIWLVDLSRSTSSDSNSPTQASTSGHRNFPPPPAIALQQREGQDSIAIHYNQPVVLQCLNTGLVSPIMVIRKVDKGSQVLGGNQVLGNVLNENGPVGGGECGDEALGDPVSQLHKIAFQIVTDPSLATQYAYQYYSQELPLQSSPNEWKLPHLTEPQSTYLACLEDVVGMHKTTSERYFLTTLQQQQQQYLINQQEKEQASIHRMAAAATSNSNNNSGASGRRRRVSCDITTGNNSSSSGAGISMNSTTSLQYHHHPYDHYRRRVNSLNDGTLLSNSGSVNNFISNGGISRGAGRQYHRRNSTASTTPSGTASATSATATDKSHLNNGACWTEDVSDASIWTIVGTDYITYKFCLPRSSTMAIDPICCAPFPILTSFTCAIIENNNSGANESVKKHLITLHGENFTKDLAIWFGDIQSPSIEYKSKETIICTIPSIQELKYSSTCIQDNDNHKIPLLFIRNSIIYNTDQYYYFQ